MKASRLGLFGAAAYIWGVIFYNLIMWTLAFCGLLFVLLCGYLMSIL